ncbi:MAG TPA: glycosyltransferase [Bryobacteraceae bacterium]|nr:glycosyltransferase [Bryobacteraceae bacterium]
MWIAYLLGACSLAAWIYLVWFHGGFWQISETPECDAPEPQPSVVTIVPARNEESLIAVTIASLFTQDYNGRFRIVLVDDHSTDATIEAAGAHGRLSVIRAAEKPAGWTGKLWAVSEGLRYAEPYHPDYYLLTDADIIHSPETLSRLVARAEAGRLDLVSSMVKLRAETLAERALIPAFVFFFFMLFPPEWVASRQRTTAAAAGGCMLIRRTALERIGGIASIGGELIDDCALARAVKPGGAIWLGTSEESRSVRAYDTFGEIGGMISRSAFTQLRHSALLLGGTIVAMMIIFVAPLLLLFSRDSLAMALGLAAWGLMTYAYLPMLRFYRQAPGWGLLLPFVALFYTGATVHSAWRYWSGKGGEWKGRVQDARRSQSSNL